MTGIGPATLIGDVGIPWLMGTDLVDAHKRAFLCESRRMVGEWQKRYPVLRNLVDARYTKALRWLTWLGFTLGPPRPYGRGIFRLAERVEP